MSLRNGRVVRKPVITFGVSALLCALFIAFILGSAIVKASSNGEHVNDNKYFTNIIVEQGDTLWDIAESNMDYNHYNNIGEYLTELRSMNNLNEDNLYTGQNIIVTYYTTN